MSDASSNASKRMLSIGLAAIIVLSSIVVVLPVQAQQQQVQIRTSADDHNNRFFGPAWVEVVIDSVQHRNDSGTGTLQVNITAFGVSQNFAITETSGTSGLFVIYLKVDDDRTDVDHPAVPANPFSATHTRILIGDGTPDAGYGTVEELDVIPANIVNGGSITINVTGAPTKTLTYGDSSTRLELDRTPAEYGPGSEILLRIIDQDANLDPTATDLIEVANDNIIITGDDAPAGNVQLRLRETGPNTAKFEVDQINNASAVLTAGNLPAGVTSASRALTVNDFDLYSRAAATSPNAPANPASPVGSQSISYEVKLTRGTIQPFPTLSYASELPVQVIDVDRNTSSRSQQTITNGLRVGTTDFNLREENLNSSKFVPAYSNDVIRLTFKENTDPTRGIFNVTPGNDIVVQYRDPLSDLAPNSVTSERTFRLNNTPPTLTVDKSIVGRSAILTLTLEDPDLNDDANIRESYTITFLAGQNTDFKQLTSDAGNPVFALRIRINGQVDATGTSNFSVTFTEESNNSSKFIATVDLQQFATARGLNLTDGDSIEFTVEDRLDQTVTVRPEASATVTIGLPRPTLTVDRTTVGVPRDPASDDNINIADGSAGTTNNISNLGPAILRIRIEDSAMDRDPRSQETLIPQLTVAAGTNNVIDSADNAAMDRLKLTFVNSNNDAINNARISITSAIRETGVNTGVFEGVIEVFHDPTDNPATWIGSRVRIEYAGPDGTFNTTDDADAVSVTFTARNAVLQTDSSIIANGQTITITVIDDDANRDTDNAEQIVVGLRWTNENDQVVNAPFTLDETGKNTGIFSKKLEIGKTVAGGQTVRVKADTDFRIRYYDLTPNLPGANAWPNANNSQTQFELTFRTTAITGSLILDPAEKVGPATRVKVTILDSDMNTNPSQSQNIQGRVTVSSDRGAASRATLTVSETGPDTGIFEGKIRLNPARNAGSNGDNTTEVTINVLPGDVVAVRYEDESGADGRRTFITKTLQVTSWDPDIKFDKDAYKPGDSIVITITDPDANRDADTVDILTIRAVSSTDPVGLTNVQAIETERNSGVFVARVPTSTGVATGALMVKEGDEVTIEVRDDFPSDFRQRFDAFGTLDAAARRFQATTAIGVILAPTERFAVQQPRTVDQAGNPTTPSVNVPVSIATQIKNNTARAMDYVYIVQVKDANGVVVSISTVSSTLDAGRTANVSASWTPTAPGTYTIETFVWSELGKPSPLSPVQRITVTVE
ncbi:MAG: hypothetical protein QW560_01050 [Candidatus Nitrosocaldus sp.]